MTRMAQARIFSIAILTLLGIGMPDISSASSTSVASVDAVVTPIAIGGELYTYSFPNGEIERVPVPPSNFDPLTASAIDLATYDFPAKPTDESKLSTWDEAMANYKWSGPPATAQAISDPNGNENAAMSSPNWTGYSAGINNSSSTAYVGVDGESIAPNMVSNGTCVVGGLPIATSVWVGLGGTNSSGFLVQQGIEWCENYDGMHTSPGWYPFTQFYGPSPDGGPTRALCGYSTWNLPQGDVILNEMGYVNSTSTANFYLEDVTSGVGHGCSRTPPTGWSFTGNTADWVTEEPDYSIGNNIYQFALAKYDSFATADDTAELNSTGSWVTVGSQSNTQWTPTGCATSYTQSDGALGADNKSFALNWNAYTYSGC